jgi:hypothetical protein
MRTDDDLKCPNCGNRQRVFSASLSDGVELNDEPPLSPDERRRRVVLLCCSFMRNLAFHRAGLEVQGKLLDQKQAHGAFWLEVHGNFFDKSVLDWCKLFADNRGKHHWRRVVESPDRFAMELYAALGVTVSEFDGLVEKVKRYRDRFVAHLDEEREMLLPALETAKGAVIFLHKRLVKQAAGSGDWRGLPTSPEELEQGFAQATREARSVYAEAR